jgi:hypothetical protein
VVGLRQIRVPGQEIVGGDAGFLNERDVRHEVPRPENRRAMLGLAEEMGASGPGESPPQALTDPYVNLSIHALTIILH